MTEKRPFLQTVLAHRKAAVVLLILCAFSISTIVIRLQKEVLYLGVVTGSAWDVPGSQSMLLVEQAVAAFEAEHPNVEVRCESGISADDYTEWLNNKIVLGDEPDVFMVLPDDFALLAGSGALANLDVLDPQLDAQSSFYLAPCQAGLYEGRRYALPFESNPDLLFVNQSLLEQMGTSSDALLDLSLDSLYELVSQSVQDSSGILKEGQVGIVNYTWIHAANAMGVPLFDDAGLHSLLANTQFRQVLDYARSLDALHEGQLAGQDDFDDGRAVFAVMSFAEYRTYKPYPWRIRSLASFDWDAIPMPQASQDAFIECPTLQMAISSRSSKQELALELLHQFCLDASIQSLISQYSQGLSTLRGVLPAVSEVIDVDSTTLERLLDQPGRVVNFDRYQDALSRLDVQIKDLLLSDTDWDLKLLNIQTDMDHYLNNQLEH